MTKEQVREIIKNNRLIKDRLKAVKSAKWFGTGFISHRVGDVVKKYGKTYVQLSASVSDFHYAYFVEVEE